MALFPSRSLPPRKRILLSRVGTSPRRKGRHQETTPRLSFTHVTQRVRKRQHSTLFILYCKQLDVVGCTVECNAKLTSYYCCQCRINFSELLITNTTPGLRSATNSLDSAIEFCDSQADPVHTRSAYNRVLTPGRAGLLDKKGGD